MWSGADLPLNIYSLLVYRLEGRGATSRGVADDTMQSEAKRPRGQIAVYVLQWGAFFGDNGAIPQVKLTCVLMGGCPRHHARYLPWTQEPGQGLSHPHRLARLPASLFDHGHAPDCLLADCHHSAVRR